jgi:hypothetical protein
MNVLVKFKAFGKGLKVAQHFSMPWESSGIDRRALQFTISCEIALVVADLPISKHAVHRNNAFASSTAMVHHAINRVVNAPFHVSAKNLSNLHFPDYHKKELRLSEKHWSESMLPEAAVVPVPLAAQCR